MFISVYKPVSLCTGECMHEQKKTCWFSHGLYMGGTIGRVGLLTGGILRNFVFMSLAVSLAGFPFVLRFLFIVTNTHTHMCAHTHTPTHLRMYTHIQTHMHTVTQMVLIRSFTLCFQAQVTKCVLISFFIFFLCPGFLSGRHQLQCTPTRPCQGRTESIRRT